MATLNDYSAALPRRTFTHERPAGPLQTPIIPQREPADKGLPEAVDRLDRMIKLLQNMPEAIQAQFRRSYLEGGRDQQAFCFTGTATILAGALLSPVLTFTVRDNFEGAIKSIGFNTNPGTSIQDILWSLRINNTLIHPGLDNTIFYSTEIARDVPFPYELLQNRTIEILASNTSLVDVDVDVRVSGYQSYMSEWKQWGSSPQSGL